MKKIAVIILIGIVVLNNSIYAQEPTKQETMDWLGEKMRVNLSKNSRFINYSNGVFTYQNSSYYSGDTHWDQTTIHLDQLKDFQYNSSVIYLIGPHISTYWYNYSDDKDDAKDLDIVDISGQIPIDKDPSLLERFKKAVDTLIKYNTQKSVGEKF